MDPRPRLVLASASPARLKSLRAAGIDPEVIVSGVDETAVRADRPEQLALVLARLKAQAVAARLPAARDGTARRLVLGCDSVLEFDGEIFGKPADAGEAMARWRRMRGHRGVLHTGHCVIEVDRPGRAEATGSTTVHFAEVCDTEIAAYVATGEPLQVAGAFTIDGLGGAFVTSIEGDPGTVIGVSLPVLRRLLAEVGVPITDLWRR